MEARLDHIAGDYAVLKLADQQELKWPIKMLPSDYKIGMRIWLKVETRFPLKNHKEKSFKDFLNEILKEDSTVS